jgi:hypothetical protein
MFEFAGNFDSLQASGSTALQAGTTARSVFCAEQELPGSTSAAAPLSLQERYYHCPVPGHYRLRVNCL